MNGEDFWKILGRSGSIYDDTVTLVQEIGRLQLALTRISNCQKLAPRGRIIEFVVDIARRAHDGTD